MRLELLLPPVDPENWQAPSRCPYTAPPIRRVVIRAACWAVGACARCGGRHFRLHQVVAKPVRDTVYKAVTARCYHCLRCRRTFRVYPTGVKRTATSWRVKGVAVTRAPERSAGVLYLLGPSYGAVALASDTLGANLCKSQVKASSLTGARPGMTLISLCYALISCRRKATKLPTTKSVIHSTATSKAAA